LVRRLANEILDAENYGSLHEVVYTGYEPRIAISAPLLKSEDTLSEYRACKRATRKGPFETFLELVVFFYGLAARQDEMAKIAARTLLEIRDGGEGTQWEEEQKKVSEEGVGSVKKYNEYRQLLREVVICRQVDNFLTYISEFLALIFRARPQTLRSNETERLDFILAYSSMEDLINSLAEKRVEALSYQGMSDLIRYMRERLGFDLFENKEREERAVQLIEVRNIIVHNRGIASRTFLRRMPHFPAKIGEKVRLGDLATKEMELFPICVCDIDVRGAAKFGLPQSASRGSIPTIDPDSDDTSAITAKSKDLRR
jgi:hypothetical protein